MATDVWLAVGLGNPGDRYRATRHNVGHMVVDELAGRLGESFRRHPRANASVVEGRPVPGGPKLVLAKSHGYMNTSGGPVSQLAKYYSVPNDRVIVIHDELDLPFDTIKLKRGGGHGGHNGLRDISSALGPDYLRVRVGIGRPPGRQDPADYVLKPFDSTQRDTVGVLVQEAADAVELIAERGLVDAQQVVHSKVR
ncbi:aminoacyl-tRNA hydrolase [Gulosibacter molinativorax]|uniref:Peptidyl-tRNA hydrolase n=1 Tax=Gulosibacter molinativorax TaxID=256821 RepID=A0ABT7C6K9_9MICO|nr:aminoacyl-tRNA hydrolase [Gulosibacter molinativorax]MDJ1370826.1 aminoacyl-tRNA hydrolase [Gulosibacter molinativorax]QUY62163.1 Peptidyl-tRNA hydrolase [Gulosibacter molinativorax]